MGRNLTLDDFDYELPEELIATRPARPRSAARLLVAEGDRLIDARVADLPRFLRPGDRLVLNDTRVIPARLAGRRHRATPAGEVTARVELTLIGPLGAGRWKALARPLKKLRPGDRLAFAAGLQAEVEERAEGHAVIRFDREGAALEAALEAAGEIPLPPYIAQRRRPDAADREDYQAVWARRAGSVAAPTASLHFDQPLLEALEARGVDFSRVTLHVGAGTFLPVKERDITRHRMHREWGEVGEVAVAEILATRRAGGRVIPVGTTALRILETAAAGGELRPFRGETDIFIRPGYRFRVADALMTNFHLPRSTLLMLVAALMGLERIRRIYAHAVEARYRFFSYGDASLLVPPAAD